MKICAIALLLPVLFNASTVQASERHEKTRPTITVVVCDKVGLAPEMFRAARDNARKVFENADTDLIWLDSEGDRTPTKFLRTSFEGCVLPSGDIDFLAVISRESPKGSPPGMLGLSIPTPTSPQRIYVLYDQVKKVVSGVLDVEGPTLVGHVVAHELGHILLAESGHTPSGIMSTGWRYDHLTQAAQGLLRFDPAQAKRIRIQAQIRSARNDSQSTEASVLRSAAIPRRLTSER